jgi:hypothetical protein
MGGGFAPAVFCPVVVLFFLPQDEMRKRDNNKKTVMEDLIVVEWLMLGQ